MNEKRERFSKHRSLLIMNLLLIVCTLFLVYLKPIDHLRDYRIFRVRAVEGAGSQLIYGDLKVQQSFTCAEDIDSFEIYFTAVDSNYHGRFEVILRNEQGEILKTWQTDKLEIQSGLQGDNNWLYYCFEEKKLPAGSRYTFEISAPELTEQTAVALRTFPAGAFNPDKGNELEAFLLNGEQTDRILYFSVYRKQTNVFFVFAVFALFLMANYWWINRKKDIRKLALPVLLGTGVIMMLVMAPGSQPDETYHYHAAMKLSNIMMGESRNIQETEDKLDQKTDHYNQNDSYLGLLQDPRINDETADEKTQFNADGLIHPLAYLAPAMGMTLGRLLKMSQPHIYELARIFTMLSYIGMAWIAIRLIPRNRELFLLICITPMFMHQAVSTSRDVLVNGMSLIFFAWYMKILYEGKPFTWKQVFISIVMLVVFTPVKVVYGVLAFLALLVPGNQFKSKWDRTVKLLTIVIISLAYIIMTEKGDITYNLTASAWAGKTDYYHFDFVLAHPFHFARYVLNTMNGSLIYFLKDSIGRQLAGLSVSMTEYLPFAYMGILLIAAQTGTPEMKQISGFQRTILIFTPVLGYATIIAAFFFANTLYGSTSVSGMQGRYLIPFLPPLIYGLRTEKISVHLAPYKVFYAVWLIYLWYIVDLMSQISV